MLYFHKQYEVPLKTRYTGFYELSKKKKKKDKKKIKEEHKHLVCIALSKRDRRDIKVITLYLRTACTSKSRGVTFQHFLPITVMVC